MARSLLERWSKVLIRTGLLAGFALLLTWIGRPSADASARVGRGTSPQPHVADRASPAPAPQR